MSRIRAYFKLDLYFFEHPKVVGLSSDAIVLYIASIAYCNRRETDGFVAAPILRRLMDFEPHDDGYGSIDDVAHELVKAELWELVEGGWEVHDFLDHNESSDERDDRRAGERDRKRRSRAVAKGPSGNVPPDKGGRPAGQKRPSEPVRGIAVAVTEHSDSREEPKPLSVVPTDLSDDPADILDVWDAWKRSTGKQRADLNPTRRRAITKALDAYPTDDVLDAVQGWVNDPWPERGQHNDITQLLHMGTQRKPLNVLEKMRDLWRDGPPVVLSKQTAQAIRTSQANRARAQELNGDHDLRRMGGPGRPAERGLPAPADRRPDH